MRLSYTVKGWEGFSWDEFCDAAKEAGLRGIELHSKKSHSFADTTDPFDPYAAKAIVRRMQDRDLYIPCMASSSDMSGENKEEIFNEISQSIHTAENLGVRYVRVHAETQNGVTELLKKLLPVAEKSGVTLLLETAGVYSDTLKLRDVLNLFASDNLASLWDMHNTMFISKEEPEKTIENLGAYVRHVHIKDSDENGYCLLGEGNLPLEEMMTALRSVNYAGFISLEWEPQWLPEIDSLDVILAHFASVMNRFENTHRSKRKYYHNKADNGVFIYKKEALIDKTFSDILDDMADNFPDQYAVKYTTLDYTRTYLEFREDVDRFARCLISMGVKHGSHVAVWATNIPQWYIAFWAVTKIGGVLVTMNTAYKIHEAEYLLKQSDTHTLIMINGYRDSDYGAIMSELCPETKTNRVGEPLHCKRLPFLRNIITVGFSMPGCMTWEDAWDRYERVPMETVRRLSESVDSHDVCNMQYTSGTTGFPKGVMLTHHNIVNNGKCIGDRMDLSTADRMMIHVPMFHCFGMVLAMTASITHGATILPMPYFSPRTSLDCINREKITCFHGVPTMFIAMLEHKDFNKTDFSYMRTGIMAGSPCPISVMQDVVTKMHMPEITIVYGQTESSPGCTMSSADDPLEVRVTTVGHPLPEIECKIVDPETGKDLPDNVTGEFVARGYNIMKGYYKMPKATAAAIDEKGWLHTGDLACRTVDGNYRITGRLKDMIIRGGENIYPK